MPFSGIEYCDKCGDSSSTGNPCHRCQISSLTAQLAEAKADTIDAIIDEYHHCLREGLNPDAAFRVAVDAGRGGSE
jgi:hypothetical protein